MNVGGYEIEGQVIVAVVGALVALVGGFCGVLGWTLKRILTRPDERADALAAQMTTFMTSQNAFNAQLQAEVVSGRELHAELRAEVRACHEKHAECERRCLGLETRLARVEREALADPPEDQAD